MELRILGAHQWESTSHKCACALIDGRIAIDAGSVCSTLSLDEQAGVGALLLSHYHLDHIKDYGALAFQTGERRTLDVLTSSVVRERITSSIIDDGLWLDLEEYPNREAPAVRYRELNGFETEQFEGYRIRAVPVTHSVPCTGFDVLGPDGRRLFYTADTGPEWVKYWPGDATPVDLLITEVTYANRLATLADQVGHQTPAMLERALRRFRENCGYLPRVVVTHLQPPSETEIRDQVAAVATEIGATIVVATEDQRFAV